MGFELGRLVREAAGAMVSNAARELRRRARAGAARVWRELGEVLRARPGDDEPGADARARGGGVEANSAVGPRTQAMVATMAEVLARSGYREVRADVAGREPPELIRGTVRSHRPSLAALGGGRPVLLDVFVPGETLPDDQLSRWHLFASAADQLEGEFHVAIPAWFEGASGRDWVRRLGEAAGVNVTKVWEY